MRATIAAEAASGRGEKRAHEDSYPDAGAVPEQDPAQLKACGCAHVVCGNLPFVAWLRAC